MALFRIFIEATLPDGSKPSDALYVVEEGGLEASNTAIEFLKENNPTYSFRVTNMQELENGTIIVVMGSQEFKIIKKGLLVDPSGGIIQ